MMVHMRRYAAAVIASVLGWALDYSDQEQSGSIALLI